MAAKRDSNAVISAWASAQIDFPTVGIVCESYGGTPSRCTVSENGSISAEVLNPLVPSRPKLYGVECSSTTCARVSRNTIYARPLSPATYCEFACSRRGTGVVGGRYVDRNTISGSCTPTSTGIANGGRVSLNRVSGYDEATCPLFAPGNFPPRPPVNLETGITGAQYVDGNVIDIAWSGFSNVGYGIVLGGGIYLDNLIRVGRTVHVSEPSANADPLVFQNNRFGGFAFVPLYRDFDRNTDIDDVTVVNALADILLSGGNLDQRN